MAIQRVIVPYIIGVLLLVWLLEWNFKEKILNIKRNKYPMLFIGYFLVYVIGMLYSTNIKYGIFDLEIKASILIFPIIFSSFDNTFLNKLNIIRLFQIYIMGCLLATLICLCSAFYKYSLNHTFQVFYYTELSVFLHPSYFAMYLNFAIVITIYYLIENDIFHSILLKIVSYIIIILFSIMIILLSSKAGIINLALVYISVLLYLLTIKKKYISFIVFLLLISFLFFALLIIFPNSIQRVINSKDIIKHKIYLNTQSVDGTSSRIQVWKISLDIIKQYPVFGVGTGDIKDTLLKKYKENNFTIAYQKKLNSHNQYLQTWIATGVIGLLILIFTLTLPLILAFRNKNFLYLIFLFIIIMNISVESMFEVQAGVVFYGFFNSLLFFYHRNQENDLNIFGLVVKKNKRNSGNL